MAHELVRTSGVSVPFVRRGGVVEDGDLPGAVGVDRRELRSEVLDCLCNEGIRCSRPPGICDGLKLAHGVVEAEADVVGVLRLVSAGQRMRFHHEKIGHGCDQQVNAVLRARDHLPFYWHVFGTEEGGCTAVGVEGPESWHEPFGLAPPLSPRGFEEIDLDNDGRPSIVEVNGGAKLVLLVAPLVSPGGQQRSDNFSITPFFELVGVERQVDIDAPDVRLLAVGQQQAGTHPPTTTMLSENHDPSTCPRSTRTRLAASMSR
jgi:hypothetical protein